MPCMRTICGCFVSLCIAVCIPGRFSQVQSPTADIYYTVPWIRRWNTRVQVLNLLPTNSMAFDKAVALSNYNKCFS